MAESDTDQHDKTEAPSQRRLQRARDDGQVPISRELVTLASLAGGCLGLLTLGEKTAKEVTSNLARIVGNIDSVHLAGSAGLQLAGRSAISTLVVLLLPICCAAVVVLLQSRLALRWNALQLKMDHLNPIAGVRRLFSQESLIEAGRSIAKVALIALVLWHLRHSFEPVAQLALQNPRSILSSLAKLVFVTVVAVLTFQVGIAAVDLVWVRIRHAKKLRMSKHDLREELRETDGDPKIKARIKQLRLHRARKRMLAQVPKATVVITNPTHYAVALLYNREKSAAPRIVAKGMDEVAARIRKVAEENAVPVVCNPPLARALYQVALDSEILPEQYQAVAEVIAYIWKLKSRLSAPPSRAR